MCAAGSLLFSTNPLIWFQCLKAEVYPFNLLLVTGVIICVTRILNGSLDPGQSGKASALILLLLGLGFTNHSLLTAHLVPAAGLVFLLIIRRYRISDYMMMTLVFILAASIYLYLPIRSSINPGMDTGNPESVMNFVNCVSRKGTYSRFFGSVWSVWLQNIGIYLSMVKESMGLIFFAGSMLGIITLARKNWKIGMFLVVAVITNVSVTCVNQNFNANPDTGPAYLMMSTLILVVGFTGAVICVRNRLIRYSNHLISVAVISGVGVIAISWMMMNTQKSTLASDDSALRVGHAILDICTPEAAIFFGMYHNLPFVVKYLQISEGYRTDVIPISRSEMVYWPGGLENLAKRHPVMTSGVYSGSYGETLQYLAGRSSRHSGRVPQSEARDLLFNNNVWMADAYREHADSFWFPSEDDHLIRSQFSVAGPMLKFHSRKGSALFNADSFLAQRVQREDDPAFSGTKGAEVVATYYDLLCITLRDRGLIKQAIKAHKTMPEYCSDLVSRCFDTEL